MSLGLTRRSLLKKSPLAVAGLAAGLHVAADRILTTRAD